MPDNYLSKPALRYSTSHPLSTHVTHPWGVHQHSSQPVTKSRSAPASDYSSIVSTPTPSRHTTADSTTVEALLVPTFEANLHLPLAPPPSGTATKDGEFSFTFRPLLFAKLQ